MNYAALILVAAAGVGVLSAQTARDPSLPAFDAVSITSNESRGRGSSYSVSPGGLVVLTNMTVREIIARAHGIAPNMARFTVTGGSDWLMHARYDVTATAPPDTPPDRQRLMLRTLLAERFGLEAHTEIRELSVYALTVAREGTLGPQLRQSKHNCTAYTAAAASAGRDPETDPARPRDVNGRPWCSAAFILGPRAELVVRGAGEVRDLIDQVQGFLDRPLFDRTALAGNVEWVVRLPRMQTSPGADASAASVLIAFEQQLGLTLKPEIASMDVLAIDAVRSPTPD
jgi:uncharacterized protein (TIGR03435 family)